MSMETILHNIAIVFSLYIYMYKNFSNRNVKYSMIMHDVECTMRDDITGKPSDENCCARGQPTRLVSFSHKASLSSKGSAAVVA